VCHPWELLGFSTNHPWSENEKADPWTKWQPPPTWRDVGNPWQTDRYEGIKVPFNCHFISFVSLGV